MYQSFSVTSIDTNFADKKVIIVSSFDINPASVNDSTVQFISKANAVDANVSFTVKGKIIELKIDDEIVPNTEYILRISGIKSVTGSVLSAGVRRSITFNSDIKEVPIIISPVNFEEISDLKVTLKAILEGEVLDSINNKNYFIQIATDVAFINVVLETRIEANGLIVDLQDLKAGQYFIRARVESVDGKEFGNWSDKITFVSSFGNSNTSTDDDMTPQFVEEVTLVSTPFNGETPNSILIEFSGPIDPNFLNNIYVTRRDI
jgi:methionine-rich copper-binding protein CopC